MRKAFAALMSALIVGTAAGCDQKSTAPAEAPPYMADDSWRSIDPGLIERLLPSITEGFFDPASVQLQRLSLPAQSIAAHRRRRSAAEDLCPQQEFRGRPLPIRPSRRRW